MRNLFAAACAVTIVTLTSACGGDSADRPSADDISATLQGEDSLIGTAVPAEAADCIGKVLEESDLSDESLQALIDGDEDYDGTDEQADALAQLADDVAECAGTS